MNMNKKIFVTIKSDFIGFHKWDSAPKEVEFLRNLHRHLFKVSCKIQVQEHDREIEFFIFQKKLRHEYIPDLMAILDANENKMSCEMMADTIAKLIMTDYPSRDVSVEVSEDGENSGIVEYTS